MADIYLDDLRICDMTALYRMATHPQFYYRALNDNKAWVALRVVRYIVKAKLGKHFAFMRRTIKAIRLRENRELVGCVLMVDLHKKKYVQAEAGIFVAAPLHNQKIGTLARLRFLNWYLSKFDLQRLETTVHPDNIANIRMLQRAGLRQSGFITAEQKVFIGRTGAPEPRVVMSASRQDIEVALTKAREQRLYSTDIPVL
jgi:RimJ/RimL family protein N-acetyltransferase